MSCSPRLLAVLLVAVVAVAAGAAVPAPAPAAKGAVTPAGWKVRPVGREFSVPPKATGFRGPLQSALSPGGTKILAASSGLTRMNTADLFDLRRGRRTGFVRHDATDGEAVFFGVAFNATGRRAYVSGGGQNVVHVYAVGRRLKEVATIPAPYFPAGLAYGRTPRGSRLYVANNLAGPAGDTNPPGRTVTVIDPVNNQPLNVIDLGAAEMPLGVTFERGGRKAYVTHWMGRSVSVIDTATETVRSRILLSPPSDPLIADHPGAIAFNPRRDEVYTANGNSDTVSVIDTRRDRVAATIDVSLVPGAREGAMPNGIGVSPNGRRLYVALGGENAVAVVDVRRRRTIGFVPASWSPTDVEVTRDNRRIVITSANAAGMQPLRCAGPYATGDCTDGDLAYMARAPRPRTKGAVTVVRVPRRTQLRRLTRTVRRNNRALARRRAKPSFLDGIKHVIYVIKENRTYDQILGDLGKGKGDPDLALFKDDSAPNHRELARRFVLFDRFFADADVSADGQSWAAGAGVTDYVSKMWPITYSPLPRRAQRARDFEHIDAAELFSGEPLAFDESVLRGAAAPTRGYLWDNAYEHGVSFRSYGMFTKVPGDCDGTGNTSSVTRLDDTRYGDHVDERFPGFNMLCSDHVDRFGAWLREFRAYEAALLRPPFRDVLPQLTIMRLPNDHTWGTAAGRATPLAYMADNDLALGKLVETVSHSPFWRNTVIMVTEDDAQNGPDHVDAHRTVSYVISPWTQTAKVDSTHYDTAAMVATIEDLLGLPPMAIADQRAVRMWKAFSSRPDFRPYRAIHPEVTPFGAPGAEVNPPSAPLARQSASWDFDVEDATPEVALNRAIWKSINGRDSAMPAPRHDLIIGSMPIDGPE